MPTDTDIIFDAIEEPDDNLDCEPHFDDDASAVENKNTGLRKRKTRPPAVLNLILVKVTEEYIKELDANNLPHPFDIECELIARTNHNIAVENQMIPLIPDGPKGKLVKEYAPIRSLFRLEVVQIAILLNTFHRIIRIDTAETGTDKQNDLLGIYVDDPENPDYGLYDINEESIYSLAKNYDRSLETRKFDEILRQLKADAPRKTRYNNRDIIAVNNGLFNYKTKQLEPFSPDRVFLTKTRVDYIPNAVNPVITNTDDGTTWDVESWMSELSDDKDIVDLLWKTLSCIIRPFVRWGRSVWLYSTVGNNGKGTLCLLMRNLCGPGTHTSIALSEFNKDFALEPLLRANAIIVDENNVGEFIEKSANLKAAVTNDIIQITRKYHKPLSYRFWGFMVQCVNDLPRSKDKSDSFYRRQITVPMEKCFTGAERRYIKDDYLGRKEVLEYVLCRLLNEKPFYEIEPTKRCRELLGEYKDLNDPVRAYFAEFHDKFIWDFLPTEFLHELYQAWCKRFNPSGAPESLISFRQRLSQLLINDETAIWMPATNPIRTKTTMSAPEPLIIEYNLTGWKSKLYIGKDPNQICVPTVKEKLHGFIRKSVMACSVTRTTTATVSTTTTVTAASVSADT